MNPQRRERKKICCSNDVIGNAYNELMYHNNTRLALELADKYRYFHNTDSLSSNWLTLQPHLLYKSIADKYPGSKFLLLTGENESDGDRSNEEWLSNDAIRHYFNTEIQQSDRLFEMKLEEEAHYSYVNGTGWSSFCNFISSTTGGL